MPEGKSYHLMPVEFRSHGRAVVDWIADYYEQVENFPVLSPVQPGQIRATLPADPPQHGTALVCGQDPYGRAAR